MKDIVTDFAQFASLRASAEQEDPEALKNVAQKFETMFLETVLKSMRKASLGDPIFGASNHDAVYQQMFDSQLASEVASGPGVGLAELLVRQLGPADRTEQSLELPELKAGQVADAAKASSSTDGAVVTPLEFARKLWPYAKRVASQLGVQPQAVLAQAALETGWGSRVMQRPDGQSSNNYFGIKADLRWDGEQVSKQTLEFRGGLARREQASFRAYDSESSGFTDYLNFLKSNPRYSEVFDHGDDVHGFACALQEAGYATDPDYAKKISDIAEGATMREAMSTLKFGGLTPIDH
ncbi:MAG: glucosaminidase domain-containing protein [Pseudomonadota bacterium]